MPGNGLALIGEELFGNRRTRRGLARVNDAVSIETLRIEATAEIQMTKEAVLAAVGGKGMQSVAALSKLEEQLCDMVPHATKRISAIADITAMGIGELVWDTRLKLR